MKKIITWIIVGVVAGLVGGYFIQSCRDAPLKAENAAMKADIAKARADLEYMAGEAVKEMDKLLEQIGGLQGNIDSLMTINAQQENELNASHNATTVAEAQADALMKEIQPVLDANPKVREAFAAKDLVIASVKAENFTLVKQVDTWKDAFTNSELKGLDYKKGMDVYKGLWEGEKGLRQKIEIRLNLQDKRVGILGVRIKLISTAAVVVGTAGLLAILLK